MANLTQDQAAELVFIPYPEGVDDEQFSDYDSTYGMSVYVDISGGIVVAKQHEQEYQELMQQAAKYFA